MRNLGIFATMMLAACNTPPVAFRNSPVTRAVVDQSQFDIRVVDDRVLAIRTNPESGTQLVGIDERATRAIIQSTGCSVVAGSMESDEVFFHADLECSLKP